MSILDRAVAHFDKQEINRIEVPEWQDESGNPTVLYSKPMTLQDQRTLAKFAKDSDIEFFVRVIIMKAMDADGKKVFDIGDKLVLMNRTDPNVILRVASQMTKTQTIEEFEGN
jgi:hypothetical protein